MVFNLTLKSKWKSSEWFLNLKVRAVNEMDYLMRELIALNSHLITFCQLIL